MHILARYKANGMEVKNGRDVKKKLTFLLGANQNRDMGNKTRSSIFTQRAVAVVSVLNKTNRHRLLHSFSYVLCLDRKA